MLITEHTLQRSQRAQLMHWALPSAHDVQTLLGIGVTDGVIRMQLQAEPRESTTKFDQKPPGIRSVLESRDNVIIKTHEVHISSDVSLSPVLGPQVKRLTRPSISDGQTWTAFRP
jgi:hypothetical protein